MLIKMKYLILKGGFSMKKFVAAVTLVSLAVLAGCGVVNKSQFESSFESVVKTNIEANLEIGEKISGSASETCLFRFLCFGPNHFADGVTYGVGGGTSLLGFQGIEGYKVKSAAAYEAVTKANADVIVAPRYTVETTDFLIFKTTNATVTGYKGSIKGIAQKK